MICNSLWICYKQIWQRISKQSTEHFLTVEIKKLELVTVLISYKLKPRAFYSFYLKYLIWFFSNYSKVFLTCSRHKISTSWNTSPPKLRSKCALTSYHLIFVTVTRSSGVLVYSKFIELCPFINIDPYIFWISNVKLLQTFL